MARNTFSRIGQKVTCGTFFFIVVAPSEVGQRPKFTITKNLVALIILWCEFHFWLLVAPECGERFLHATIHRWPCDLARVDLAVAGAGLPMSHMCSCDLRELSRKLALRSPQPRACLSGTSFLSKRPVWNDMSSKLTRLKGFCGGDVANANEMLL